MPEGRKEIDVEDVQNFQPRSGICKGMEPVGIDAFAGKEFDIISVFLADLGTPTPPLATVTITSPCTTVSS